MAHNDTTHLPFVKASLGLVNHLKGTFSRSYLDLSLSKLALGFYIKTSPDHKSRDITQLSMHRPVGHFHRCLYTIGAEEAAGVWGRQLLCCYNHSCSNAVSLLWISTGFGLILDPESECSRLGLHCFQTSLISC